MSILNLQSNLKTEFGLARCVKTNNIGKYIGGCVYIHKSEIDNVGLPQLRKLISFAPAGTKYDIVKIDLSNTYNDSVSLIESPDWETSNEPLVGDCVKITINTEEQLSIRHFSARKQNQLVYHHKWMFVSENSDLFNIEESMQRSLQWLPTAKATNINKSKIGGSIYWDQWLSENNISPRL
ncbi:hypothetical protein [Photobacterium damselae]|uniref:hypothetical protein n=1 Tax=Photobacterium damselae TaxID=38293 RepID=UPI0040684F3F